MVSSHPSSDSSSDSELDEPMRRIKINIKPKEAVAKRDGADVEAIKASVEAWRPLGPRPHPSLSRRQSSLSSVSSLSFGAKSTQVGCSNSSYTSSSTAIAATVATSASSSSSSSASANANQFFNQYHQPQGMFTNLGNNNNFHSTQTNNNSLRSSPSCSSLVNEFSSRTSFSNFMSNTSRTSSPLTLMNSNYGDTVPIAVAIQESLELTVKAQRWSDLNGCNADTKFETRALGNIKVAFPNSFARLCSLQNGGQVSSATSSSLGLSGKQIPSLKLRLHATENIIRYYASGLVKDLDESNSLTGSVDNPSHENNNNGNADSLGSDQRAQQRKFNLDLFDMNESPTKTKGVSKLIEFDMTALSSHIKRLFDQSPNSRYFNVDVLRYQLTPIDQFEKCPLQVCAYWKLEPKLIKLRIDFKHSNGSGLNLERFREISFQADFSNLVPADLRIRPVLPEQISTLTKASPNYETGQSNLTSYNAYSNFKHETKMAASDSAFFNTSGTVYGATENSFGGHTSSLTKEKLIDVNETQTGTNSFPSSKMMPSPPPLQLLPQQQFVNQNNAVPIKLPPPPSSGGGHSRSHHQPSSNYSIFSNLNQLSGMDTLKRQPPPFVQSNVTSRASGNLLLDQLESNEHGQGRTRSVYINSEYHRQAGTGDSFPVIHNQTFSPDTATSAKQPTVPYITYEPQASWDDKTRRLEWKFDNLLSFYKNDGYGSLLAKLDFRNCNDVDLLGSAKGGLLLGTDTSVQPEQGPRPHSIDIKFTVVDSTLSKTNLSIDSTGYRMTLLKREVRSGRYKSEPCTF